MRKSTPLSVIAFLLTIVSSLPSSISARDITMLSTDWASHSNSDIPENRLTTALVKAAFKAAGRNAEIKFIHWTGALNDVKEASVAEVMAVYPRVFGDSL